MSRNQGPGSRTEDPALPVSRGESGTGNGISPEPETELRSESRPACVRPRNRPCLRSPAFAVARPTGPTPALPRFAPPACLLGGAHRPQAHPFRTICLLRCSAPALSPRARRGRHLRHRVLHLNHHLLLRRGRRCGCVTPRLLSHTEAQPGPDPMPAPGRSTAAARPGMAHAHWLVLDAEVWPSG